MEQSESVIHRGPAVVFGQVGQQVRYPGRGGKDKQAFRTRVQNKGVRTYNAKTQTLGFSRLKSQVNQQIKLGLEIGFEAKI